MRRMRKRGKCNKGSHIRSMKMKKTSMNGTGEETQEAETVQRDKRDGELIMFR